MKTGALRDASGGRPVLHDGYGVAVARRLCGGPNRDRDRPDCGGAVASAPVRLVSARSSLGDARDSGVSERPRQVMRMR